jgi:hypothetical protein
MMCYAVPVLLKYRVCIRISIFISIRIYFDSDPNPYFYLDSDSKLYSDKDPQHNTKIDFSYLMFHSLGQNVLVEAAGEVALQQLIVVDRLGNHSAHKLEVVQVVGVDVGKVVDCVGYPAILQQM